MFKNYSNYEVYEDGRIWSYCSNKFLKPVTNHNGYQVVGLTDDEGIQKWYMVHRVVYQSVTGEPIPEWFEVNHLDEDKTNNHISNLNLMTHKENCNFGTRNERAAKSISKAMTNNTKISKAVGAFKDENLVMLFPSTREAGRLGFDQGAVSKCCNNCYIREGNNIYKGFEWKYI